MNGVNYNVNIEYALNDKASAALGNISTKADSASRSLEYLKTAFISLAGGFGLTKAIDAAKSSFIDFNSALETANVTMATQLNVTGMVKSFEEGQVAASALNAELLRFSKTAPGEFSDYIKFTSQVSTALGQAGASLQDLKTISEQGVVAAKVFNVDPATLSQQISESLTRPVNAAMGPMKLLLAAAHVTAEEYNKMGGHGKIDAVRKGIDSSAMKRGAEELGKTFDAQINSLKDNLTQVGAKIGLPLFKSITTEIQKWNDWFDKNPKKIEEIVGKFSHDLIDAFNVLKDGIGFVVDHKQTLMAIAGAYAAIRLGGGGLGGMAGKIAGGVIGGAALEQMFGAGGAWNTAVSGVIGAFQAIPGPVGAFATALQLAKLGLESFLETLDESSSMHAKNHVRGETLEGLYKNFERNGGRLDDATYKDALEIIQKNKLYDNNGKVDFARRGAYLGQLTDLDNSGAGAAFKLFDAVMRRFKDTTPFGPEEAPNTVKDPLSDKRGAGTGNVNVIITQQVMSDDPDRFADMFNDRLESVGQNPTRAREILEANY